MARRNSPSSATMFPTVVAASPDTTRFSSTPKCASGASTAISSRPIPAVRAALRRASA